jgi:tetratricopeptide (TPR) repeat protein
MPHISAWSALALVLVLALTSSSQVRADSTQQESMASPAARAAFEEGRTAYDSGRFAEALVAFERAYALSPHPMLLYNIGRSADSDGQVDRAIAAYSSFLSSLPDAENRAFVQARIEKLEAARANRNVVPNQEGTPQPAALPSVASATREQTGAQAPALALGPSAPVREDKPALWKRGWLWAAVGAVVVGGVVTATVLALRDDGTERPRADVRVTALEQR